MTSYSNTASDIDPLSGGMHSSGSAGITVEPTDIVGNVAQGAHHTIDRLAEQLTPHVQRLQEGMSEAGEMLDLRADQLRELTEEWTESLSTTVRDHPLTSLAAALAIGMLLARLSR